jgi:threonine dehydrogenase-like Zn-dependent dehydrogenase
VKALVYTQPNEVQLHERPEPGLEPGEVVLRIDAAGICGSDMHAYHGHDPRRLPGLVLGHEFAATVQASAAPQWRVGQRVTGNPLITCGRCEYCLQGRDNLCARRTMVGMTRPGAFAESMSIPERCLIELPPTLDAVRAALTEPAATAVHAVNLSLKSLVRPLPECRVLVIGGGAIGMLAALLLRHHGVDRLDVAEVHDGRRAAVARQARCHGFDPRSEPAAESAYGYVIDAVGGAVTRKTAIAAVKPGGVVMHIGLQDWASEIDMRRLTLAEITLLGTYTYSQADLVATVAALDRGVFGDLSWVQARPLAEAPVAFDDLHHGRTASAKVVLLPGG